MSAALLPAGLPAGFTLEPATGDHAAEVFRVLEAEQIAAFGFCVDTVEDARASLEQPTVTQSVQYVVRDSGGAVVQWWGFVRDPGDPAFDAWIREDPDLAFSTADRLAGSGWATILDWVLEHAPDGDDEEIRVYSMCPAGTDAGRRHLDGAGFAHVRTFWDMIGPVTETSRNAAPVPGLAIEVSHDLRTLHELLDDAFVGHFRHTPLKFDDWLAVYKSLAGHDPALWFIAAVDQAPAAAMLLSRRAVSEGELFVDVLATSAQFRGRGIASALLALAFNVAADEGLGQVSLWVDSENSHAAPALYQRAGLEVRCAFHVSELTLAR